MFKFVKRSLSTILVFALLIHLLPLNVPALDVFGGLGSAPSDSEDVLDIPVAAEDLVLEDIDAPVEVVGEDISRRSEYGKEFLLSNGIHLAAVYPTPVHFMENGQWEEIDNTLTAATVRGESVYSSGKGLWQVDFPQQLTDGNSISITKDGHTVSFGMAGELRSSGSFVVASFGLREQGNSADLLAVQGNQSSAAQLQKLDVSAAKAAAEFEETVLENLSSRVVYPSVYTNTNVIYDLSSNRLKESIVIRSYDAALWGYRYELRTDGLTPVLNENRSIDLLDPRTDTVVLSMPAPFMLDANDEYCDDVAVSLVQNGDIYLLSYYLPRDWMADADRAWPVVLDPVVEAGTTQNNILDHFVAEYYSASNTNGALMCGYYSDFGKMRTFIKFSNLPTLSSADVLVSATLTLSLLSGGTSGTTAIGAHKVNGDWATGTITWANQPGHNEIVEDCIHVGTSGSYRWDITEIARSWYASANTGVMLKALSEVESGTTSNWKKFYSVDYSMYSTDVWPSLTIQYRDAAGIEDYWDYTSGGAGRSGTGYVQNFTGNLVWVHNDIGFDGNRMPVSISHVYNAHDAWDGENSTGKNPFAMGNGWRTNFNQLVYAGPDGAYIWEDGDGTRHSFVLNATSGLYKDTDGLALTLTVTDSGYTITDKYDNKSQFNASGRLISQTNNQATTSSIQISYNTTYPNRISTILDGVNRRYTFVYENGLLKTINYYGTGSTILSSIGFGYSNSNLTSVTYADSKTVSYSYTSKNLLSTATDVDGYKLTYGYNTLSTGKPSKVISVAESDGSTAGGTTTFEYTYNRTIITDHKGNSQTMFFNFWGNTISVQDSEGRAAFARYATDDNMGATTNRLLQASQQQSTSANYVTDHSFEGGTSWAPLTSRDTCVNTSAEKYIGNAGIKIYCSNFGGDNGAASSTGYFIAPGVTYTFSAYVKSGSSGTQLAILANNGDMVSSGCLQTNDWERLEVSYTNNTASNQTVTLQVRLYANAATAYVDCVQLEKNEGAGKYNLLENADVEGASPWVAVDGNTGLADTLHSGHAPGLSAGMLELQGNIDQKRYIFQTVNVGGEAGDSLIFGGWFSGAALPASGSKRVISVTLNNTDGSTSYACIQANPHLLSTGQWQYVCSSYIAVKAYQSITFKIELDYDPNYIRIDGLQLYKEEFGEHYTYDANGNVKTVRDALGQVTAYTYTNNDPIRITMPGDRQVVQTFSNHNLTSSRQQYTQNEITRTALSEYYAYDTYGNVTMSYSESSDVTSKTQATYTANGNYLAKTIDELGNETQYGYDLNTGVLKWVQYPENGTSTRTNYEYDTMFRLKKTYSTTNQGKAMSAEYAYTNDMLTQIKTPSTTYSMAYGDMALRTGISIGGTALATYYYTHDTADPDKIDEDKLLKRLDYGNGDKVKYTYDDLGRVTQEAYYENGSTVARRTVTYAYDNSGALATTYDSKTDRTTRYYYDTVGRISSQCETVDRVSHHIGYTYDALGNVSALTESFNDGTNHSARTISYQYDGANRVYQLSDGTASEYYLYDGFSRLEERLVCHNNSSAPFLTKSVTYEDLDDERATSNYISVWSVTSTGGYSANYNISYDGNGNITSVKCGSYTTSYVYDSANQLIRENNQEAGKTWTWTYDAAGNITGKKEYAYTTGTLGTATDTIGYTYGNSAWGDLLTSYDGQTLTYDAIGNLTGFNNWSYTWDQGRQLASMSFAGNYWSFTYDSNGMRTGRTSGSTVYTYTYNGTQLSRMTYGSNTLVFTYGADGSPLSVTYNGTTYYYVVNLQGDVVAILTSSGVQVVGYTYDAWGRLINTTGSLKSTLGNYNPLRYRGYVYDRETKLYYVSSRYYNPEIGRWINADGEMSDVGGDILGYNLFAYCMNNPVNKSDPSGNWPKWATKLVAAVAVVAVVASVAAITVATAGAGTAAAVITVGAAKGAAIGLVTGAAIGAGTAAVNHRVSTGSWEGADKAALEGAGNGALSGAITGAITGAVSGATKVAQAARAWDSGTFKSGYQSMKYHYNKHVVSEGLTKGNNVLKYTQDAVSFANRNSSVLKYTYNYNYGNASWNLTYSTGQGGMFTSTGKILTFWYR